MSLSKDFVEFIACLNARRVDYLLVGGHALAFHGLPRFTKDIDFWVRPTVENAERVLEALGDFGFADAGIGTEDLRVPVIHPQSLETAVRHRIALRHRQHGGHQRERLAEGKVERRVGGVHQRVGSRLDLRGDLVHVVGPRASRGDDLTAHVAMGRG